jgi:hypothetical protein
LPRSPFSRYPQTALQGFSDPAPFVPKSLRIRYLFRNRAHYAEIPDYIPVVLPLAGWLNLFLVFLQYLLSLVSVTEHEA